MRRLCVLLPAAFLLIVASAAPARADLTAFIGAQTNPTTRFTKGISAGTGFLIIGFEGEYAQANDVEDCLELASLECAPSVRTLMFNGLVQTPRGIIPGVQLYGTVGGGYFRVRFEAVDLQKEGFGTNFGGGVKINLAGPLRVRLDYRIFRLTDEYERYGVEETSQRFYAGVNIAF